MLRELIVHLIYARKPPHLRHALGGQLWMRHVKGHSNHEWNDWADKVAGEARLGMVTNIDDATVMRRAPP